MNRKFQLKHFLLAAVILAAFVFGIAIVAYEAATVDIVITGSSNSRTEVGIVLPDRSYFVDNINDSTLFQTIFVWEFEDMVLEVEGSESGWVDVTVLGWNWEGDFAYSMEEYTASMPITLPLSVRMDNNKSFRISWGESSTNTEIPAGMARIMVIGEFDRAELVSPESEKIDLRTEGPILVPVDEVERYVVHVMGDKSWMDIVVTSYDGKARWAFALEDNTETIYQAGNSAITSYHWSD